MRRTVSVEQQFEAIVAHVAKVELFTLGNVAFRIEFLKATLCCCSNRSNGGALDRVVDSVKLVPEF